MKNQDMTESLWPTPPISEEPKPHFLFIMTLSFSGSTALSQLLNTSSRSMLLHHTGEGQWLIKGLYGKGRWKKSKPVDWESIERVWLRRWQDTNELVGSIDLVIEKSPPNLVRMEGFFETFPDHSAFAFNRDPYAFAASFTSRRKSINLAKLSQEKRSEFFQDAAKLWVSRSSILMQGIKRFNLKQFAYESFCENPGDVIRQIQSQCPHLVDVDPDAKIQVKNYEPQPIINQNPRQISWLTADDAYVINSVLQNHGEILEFFGYTLRSLHDFPESGPESKGGDGKEQDQGVAEAK